MGDPTKPKMAQKIVTMHLNDNQIEWEFLVSARITSLGAISYEEPENIALFLFPAPQLSGLLDVEQLRAHDGAAAQSCIYDANLAGLEANLARSKRPQNEGVAGGRTHAGEQSCQGIERFEFRKLEKRTDTGSRIGAIVP